MPLLSSINGTLGRKRAAHLLRRATFGPAKSDIDHFQNLTVGQALTALFQPVEKPAPPIDPATGAPWVNPKPNDSNSGDNELQDYFKGWWMEQMRRGGTSCVEKLTFFHHTHFTTIQSVVNSSTALYYQNALFRHYALGNFKELSKKICFDNAMLVFLDGRLNESGRPNENYAREFLELYSIGKGPQRGPDDYTTFTEHDVQEASKILSGYKNDPEFTIMDIDTGLASGFIRTNGQQLADRHDASTKTFSAAFQNRTIAPNEKIDGLATKEAAEQELDDFLDMIFDQEETARHICRKIYRFFVYYNITEAIENDIIIPLANIFRSNDFEIKPVLEALFSSIHFYDEDNEVVEDDNNGAIIKSPLDLLVGTLRFFKVDLPDVNSSSFYEVATPRMIQYLDEQGLELYEPYEVAGYDAYHQEPHYNRNWISSNFLARRYEFAHHLINRNADEQGFQLDIVSYVKNPANITDPSDAVLLVQELIDNLLPEEISEERFDYFLKDLLLDNLSVINWRNEWNNYISSNDDTAVRNQLESLLFAILQSPEYQLC